MKSGTERCIIDRAYWLYRGENAIDFEPSTKVAFLLGTITRDKHEFVIYDNPRRAAARKPSSHREAAMFRPVHPQGAIFPLDKSLSVDVRINSLETGSEYLHRQLQFNWNGRELLYCNTTANAPLPISPTAKSNPGKKYNFDVDDPAIISILEEKDGYRLVETPDQWRGFDRPQSAWAVEITNRAHKEFQTSYVDHVIAEMTVEGKTIGPLYWIGQGGETEFSPGKPQTVVLAISGANEWRVPRFKPRVVEGGYSNVDLGYRLNVVKEALEGSLLLSTAGKVIAEVPLFWHADKNGTLFVTTKPLGL